MNIDKSILLSWLEQTESIGLLLISTDAVVLWANPGARVIFGAADDSLVGVRYEQLFTDQDRALGAMTTELAIARSRGYSEDDRWHRRVDGGRFWADGMLSAIRDDGGAVLAYGKVVRNRTDLKEQVVALRSEVATLHDRDQSRRTSTAEAAHELRNALSGMSAVIAALRQGTADPAVLSRLADITERQLALSRRLTEELMNASSQAHVESRTLSLQPTALQPILSEAVDLVSDTLQGRRLELLMPPAPVECDVDYERMQQVLNNLLRNAIKFTAPTGTIWLRLTVEGSAAVVRVEDDGAGIEPDMLERIFEAFTQGEPAPDAAAGVGLGLSLARQIVNRFGGSIQAMSNGPGLGAMFSVRLPLSAR